MAEDVDERQQKIDALRSSLQARILGSVPSFEDLTADKVWRSIKHELILAHEDGLLDTPDNEIHQFVPKPKVEGDKVMISGGLAEGAKPFARTPEQARIKRSDGAWLHFTLTLRCAGKGKGKDKDVEELWAYDFELVFPDDHKPAFVRFDLNEPNHENEARGIRSHMHPSNENLLVPAPVMSPEELLDVLIRRLRNPRGDEKPRE